MDHLPQGSGWNYHHHLDISSRFAEKKAWLRLMQFISWGRQRGTVHFSKPQWRWVTPRWRWVETGAMEISNDVICFMVFWNPQISLFYDVMLFLFTDNDYDGNKLESRSYSLRAFILRENVNDLLWYTVICCHTSLEGFILLTSPHHEQRPLSKFKIGLWKIECFIKIFHWPILPIIIELFRYFQIWL